MHLASCSHAPLSDALGAALLEYQYTLREFGAPWERWMAEVDTARREFAALINADVDEIAVVPSASVGAFQVASTQDWSQRPRLITADAEFGSIAQVWLAQEANGAEIIHVGGDLESANLSGQDPDAAEGYLSELDERTALVSIPLITYRTGTRMPVTQVLARARQVGARTVVDAYQGTGVEPIDVRQLGCDYLISGTLKYLLGIPGLAFLYVRAGLEDGRPPAQTGWFGRVNPYDLSTRVLDRPAHARRFESGTPCIPAAFAAVAGLRLIAEAGVERIAAHIAELGRHLDASLREAGEHVLSPADDARRGPMVAIRDAEPDRLCADLLRERIIASPRGEAVRLSLHLFNDTEDLDKAVAAIRRRRT